MLWWQPDAAQAIAFATAWSIAAWTTVRRAALVPIGVAQLFAISTMHRHDTLSPVAHVEGIVAMAAERGVAWRGASVVSLILPACAWLGA